MTKKFELIVFAVKYFFRHLLRPYDLMCRRPTAWGPSYSDAGQDILVSVLLDFKKDGTYVEIGSQDPLKNNNTFLLESTYNWRGIAVELRGMYFHFYNWKRRNRCIQSDATTNDYDLLIGNAGLPPRIDFLQVDIEPAEATLEALKKVMYSSFRFTVIIFEHDHYQNGPDIRDRSRDFLSNLGYHLLVGDVTIGGKPFEDWWIDTHASDQLFVFTGLQLSSIDYSLALEEVFLFKKNLKDAAENGAN